jgi:excinuclease ABC subunit A
MKNIISIQGAREHNLANIDLDIPKQKLVVISGVSGSGKSSLAFNTIYATAQRQYLESMSTHAKQFLERLQKPELDSIEGLSPAIAIDQKNSQSNPRSTVGTITEIYDYLRVLFARAGQPWCEIHQQFAEKHTIQRLTNSILKLPTKTKLQILIPVKISGCRSKSSYEKLFTKFRKEGFVRIRINKKIFLLEETIDFEPNEVQNVEIVFDRLIIKDDIVGRLNESLEKSVALGGGLARLLIEYVDGTQEERVVSEKFTCSACQVNLPELEPSLFSFNTPQGACPNCHGLGTVMDLDLDLVIPDQTKTITQGAIVPLLLHKKMFSKFRGAIKRLCEDYNQDYSAHWNQFPEWFQEVILFGETIQIKRQKTEKKKRKKKFEGVLEYIKRRFHQTESQKMRQALADFMREHVCPDCRGARLNKYALSVRFAGKNIDDLTGLSLTELRRFLANIKVNSQIRLIADPLIKQILGRLEFLINNGVGYLSLKREAGTLSGGEAQRIKLASQLGSGLSGIIYVLDEPSRGLHPSDITKLIDNLCRLRDLGNSVIVVEHDEQIIKRADYLIDMGPQAGAHGGHVVAVGTPIDVAKNENSLTGQFISGNLTEFLPSARALSNQQIPNQTLTITNVTQNNLKSVTASFPLGSFICLTGVSGSGKSSLISQTLYPALAKRLNNNNSLSQGKFDELLGAENIDKVVNINQNALSKSPRSNPATYTGIFALLREIFSELPESRIRGYTAGRFSFNVKGGRCETCKGDGAIKTEMHFLPDVYIECADCKGRRYNQATLEVLYKGLSIADVLDLTIETACEVFKNHSALCNKLETLCAVGLGYLKLGQSTDTLSGGEAQRLKLSAELSKRQTGSTLYILDEPTTGLHAVDVQKLIEILHKLVGYGNTVIVIEHNITVIKSADWIIDIGPEGGAKGGYIIDAGTPNEIKTRGKALIGKYF